MNLKGLFGKSTSSPAPANAAPVGRRTVTLFGAQDYMVIVRGDISSADGHELNGLSHPKLREHGYFGVLCLEVPGAEPGLHVHPIYDGNWSFAVSPAEEDGAMPPWPIRRAWGTENGHSETLEIDVPPGTILRVEPPVESQPKSG